ncbi:MAG: hypothetical protein Q9164_006045, partial [Protoblastenia rupestris]
MALTYFRLLYTVVASPGYVEYSAQWHSQDDERKKTRQPRKKRSETGHDVSEKQPEANGNMAGYAYPGPCAPPSTLTNEQRPGLQDFFSHDIFVCQGDGRPIWCTHCQNWKPDRAHHCREVGRCVRKMDHFCPWVGGVVSETSFKFFTQFVGWSTVYCVFNLILMAILNAEYNQKTGTINVHWIVTVALAALFGLFTAGMTGSSLQFALVNTTTIENLSRKTVVYQLAVHMPQPPQARPPFPTITYAIGQDSATSASSPDTMKTFAILHTRPGENPWDLGAYRNLKSVMGEHWYDWLLPIKHSPCSNHDRLDSQFEMGPVVDRLKREVGILPPVQEEKTQQRRGYRRRRRLQNEKTPAKEEAISQQKGLSNGDNGDTQHDKQGGLQINGD